MFLWMFAAPNAFTLISNCSMPPWKKGEMKHGCCNNCQRCSYIVLQSMLTLFLSRNYNPKDGRRGKPITKEEAMKELIEVVSKICMVAHIKALYGYRLGIICFLQHYLIFGWNWNQVTKTKPDNFTPRIVDKTDDYIRAEYESPIFGVGG